MAKYIKEKNIKAEMTGSGVYVETITPEQETQLVLGNMYL